jgi:WD40 repeat protein
MLYRVYSARYKDIPRVTLGYPESWPEELCTVRNLGGSDYTPRYLAFSEDSSRLGLSTPTHMVIASSITGVQLGKYRLGEPRGPPASDAEAPIAQGCGAAFFDSVTSSLFLRIADNRAFKFKEVQLSPSPSSTDTLPPPSPLEVTCAAFDQNVTTLCVGCGDGRIRLWKWRRSSWEPERDGFPYSHSSAVICIAAASDLLASLSQRELKIGPCGDSKHNDASKETLTLKPRWLAEAREIRISFTASSAAAWACAVSLQSATASGHSIYVITFGDQRGKRIFSSTSPSYPVFSLSPDCSVVTIICDEILRRLSTATYGVLERRSLPGIDSIMLDRFPVISPDGRLLAVCDGDVVHIWDLMQPPLKRSGRKRSVKAAGVVMTDKCYIVKGGGQQWLAQVHDDGTFEDITQLGENEIEHLAVSADGTKLAALSFYQGKTRHGLLEIANLKSKRRSTTTWPVALHDSFTDWKICSVEFSATGKHVAMVFFLAEASYICACDLETGSLRWKQLPGKMRPLAARSLQDEVLIVVRTKDVWKVDLGTAAGTRHELYSTDPYKMATFYAKFTETKSSPILEIASRLWSNQPRYTVWNADTVAPDEKTKTECAIAHLEVPYKNSFGHWVLSNVGQRVCCIPEEYCSTWGGNTHSSIAHDRLALITGDGTVLVVDFRPMMGYLNSVS